MHIGIDPGHGGTNIGCRQNGIDEGPYVLSFAHQLARALEVQGYRVTLSRTADETVGFAERARRLAAAELVVCLHVNVADTPLARKMTTYVRRGPPAMEYGFAQAVLRGSPLMVTPVKADMLPTLCTPADWTQRAYNCLAQHRQPAALVELFFASHPASAAWATSALGLSALLRCLSAAVIQTVPAGPPVPRA